tara:strand:+ start:964 stop:1089 length:126 start_codon:yes stop_codon:yes gene_type:complete
MIDDIVWREPKKGKSIKPKIIDDNGTFKEIFKHLKKIGIIK